MASTHFIDNTSPVLQRDWIPEKPPVLLQSTVWWVFWPGGGEVHLEMLRASRLIAAAITSHSISQFYGHSQLWSSLSPFGASLETSASFLFTTSEPGLFPTVGGVCILDVRWFRHISSQIWEKKSRNACVVAVSMDLCAQFTCVWGPTVATVEIYLRFLWPYIKQQSFFHYINIQVVLLILFSNSHT